MGHIVGSLQGQGYESQLIPSHLKFGLWASLALAAIFVTSAKFYFDNDVSDFEHEHGIASGTTGNLLFPP